MVKLGLGHLDLNMVEQTTIYSFDSGLSNDGSEDDASNSDTNDTEEVNVIEYDYVGDHELLEELQDNGLDTSMKHEGPNQINNLLLEDQTKNIIFREISNYEDYEDWMKCVAKEENVQKVAYDAEQLEECLLVLQLGKQNDEGAAKVVANTHNDSIANQQRRWGQLKSKISVDPSLDPMKVDQLWQLFEQFFDVFVWHKGKLRCCKIGEHIVDTQGFPPYHTMPSRQSFQEEAKVKRQIDVLVLLGKMKLSK